MRPIMAVAIVAVLVCVAFVRAEERPPSTRPAGPAGAKGIDWSAFLIHDDGVQAELGLDEARRKQLADALAEIEQPLWALRDLPPSEAADRSAPLALRLRKRLETILTDAQRRRLAQIALQSRGPEGLLEPVVADALALSEDQRDQLAATIEKTRLALEGLGAMAKPGTGEALRARATARIRAAERGEVHQILGARQKQQWVVITGRPFDFSRVWPLRVHAPELRDARTWINSEPLALAGLRGKVVLVHFWTFGCINCIRNFPAYRAWQKQYAPRGLVIIGIHTPETAREREIETLKARAKEHELNFPILVDNEHENWSTWANRIWPAVYLIDKRGRIRCWWYGELNWKEAKGQEYISARIEELLAEPAESSGPREPATRP